MSIALPIVLFVSWFAFLLVPAGKLAIEDCKAGVPEDKRRGTSIMPMFPIMPLLVWGITVAIDHFIAPWGSISIISHGVIFVWTLVVIVMDISTLRKFETEQSARGDS